MSSPPSDGWVVKFVPFASTVESSFWVRYCQEKLDTIQLSEQPLDLLASYGGDSPRLQLLETSLSTCSSVGNQKIAVKGTLLGYNTREAFQKVDKNQLLAEYMTPLTLDKLTSFLLLLYADLKNHTVLYWFAMPAFLPTTSIQAVHQETLASAYSTEQRKQLASSLETLCQDGMPPYFLYNGSTCLALDAYDSVENKNDVVFGFFDPSTCAETPQATMGWPMRNLVAHLSLHLNLAEKTVTILSYRSSSESILLQVVVPSYDTETPKVVGWELNARSKPGPRLVNLRPLLDKRHLAIQAADLNLKLMKWRMIPSLNVELLQNTRVLLIGAGTLGCSVARVLLGWGIRHFDIIDNGTVSYSNPVRQSLFTLDDCTGNKAKAAAAAEALQKIAPDVEATGTVLTIPMPGHAVEEGMEETVTTLDKMVQDCDVVFLLTDTRESRWLPTVMAAAHDKMLINAALGLDSWLVMRHAGEMGCYFCNDVVAPENSTKNRTLDQQCTVTRPGLSPLASSMAVELMVALLHHPLQHKAPAPSSGKREFSPTIQEQDASSPLGIMPHQIRGSLVTYTMMTPTVPAFSCCTGCSSAIVESYQEDKMQLVTKACESSSYLEDLSGLTTFRAEAAEKMVDMDDDWEDDE